VPLEAVPGPVTEPSAPAAGADELLRGLDPSQRHAVTVDAAPLAILAPAGSGKTRVLTRRIAHRIRAGDAAAAHVLALTFTRKAAGELTGRLARFGVARAVTAGTFHAVALAQLRRHLAERGREMPAILDRKGRVLGPLVGRRGAAREVALSEVAAEIEWAKARLLPPDRYAAAAARSGRPLPRAADEIASIYEAYEAAKRRRGLVDFDDLIWWCASELEHSPEFAAEQRFRFRHLFVDEFQDVNPAQWRLLRAWLGDRRDLCVVGDDAQAIYGFAGADPRYLRHLDRELPGTQTVRLTRNYRSTPQVVAASNAVLGRSAGVERPPPEAALPDGPVPAVAEYADAEAEAEGVARALVAANRRGRRWSAMAVLTRTNAQSAAFERAFAQTGVPHRVAGGGRFVDRPEVRSLLDDLARVDSGADRPLADHLADLDAIAAGEGEPSEERREHAEALATLGRDYLTAEGGAGSLRAFVAWLRAALHGDDDAGPGSDRVELTTFHRAKGLEWEAVWVTGLERGLVPISYARDAGAVAEERRLLHVALSRAAHELHLTWAGRRRVGGRDTTRSPSPYLELVAGACRPGPADRPGDARAGIAAARAAARAGRDPAQVPADRELFAALKEWRRLEASARGIPAFTIFHDSTLRAIGAARPATRDELLAVAGVGPAKLDRYGDRILAIVAEHPPRS
jgi:DNA helicase-2/ATP-dependent DNA helicase PcrA